MDISKCSNLDKFCFVCGHLVCKTEGKEPKDLFSPEFRLAYTQYFDESDLSDTDFTPNTVCNACYSNLLHWLHGRRAKLQYYKPVIWVKDPSGHCESRCYACINFSIGSNKKKLKTKKYVAAFTASLPVPLCADVEPPNAPCFEALSTWTAQSNFTNETNFQDPSWMPDSDDEPKPLSQDEMDYIVAKLGLSQRNSEWLTSFLKSRKVLQQNVNVTAYRKRQAEFQELYTVDDKNTFTYCNDTVGLVNKLGIEYIASDWRLFIDGSVSSLKVVLLHKTNKKPNIPLALGTNMKESYKTLEHILKKIKYNEQKWKICCDLKVVNILQGVISNGGYPKYFCFICNWDSRSKLDQYKSKHWIKRSSESEKQLKLMNTPLIKNIDDILLPPLHIKLGITKKFIEVAVKNNDDFFVCLKTIFPKLSNDKIRNGNGCSIRDVNIFYQLLSLLSTGVLNGPDIRKLMKSESFTNTLTNNHRKAWDALKDVIEGVLGKNRVPRDKAQTLVDTMLYYFHKIGASMTLKLHFLHHHLDVFLQQLPTESDEQGERFHQITMPMEKRYKGKQLDALLAEICWWSHKVTRYEDECFERSEQVRYEGDDNEKDMPLNIFSTSNDDVVSDHESERPMKKAKPSTSKFPMDID